MLTGALGTRYGLGEVLQPDHKRRKGRSSFLSTRCGKRFPATKPENYSRLLFDISLREYNKN